LTLKGEETFPRRYDLLAEILLDEVGSLDAREIEPLSAVEKRSLLVQRSADRIAERYRFQVEGRSLEERVAAVTNILHLIGGFAEWLRADEFFEIRDYNCVFSRLLPENENGCEWHVRLLTQLLSYPVQHEHTVDGRVQCCRYFIQRAAAEQE
jgi:predicted ArsR family transcriptional regulator